MANGRSSGTPGKEAYCLLCRENYTTPKKQTHRVCPACVENQRKMCNQGHRKDFQCIICQDPDSSSYALAFRNLNKTVNWRHPRNTDECKNPVNFAQVDAENLNSNVNNTANESHPINTGACDDPISCSNVVMNNTGISDNQICTGGSMHHPMNYHPAQQNSFNVPHPQAQHLKMQAMMFQQPPIVPKGGLFQPQHRMCRQSPNFPNGHYSRNRYAGTPRVLLNPNAQPYVNVPPIGHPRVHSQNFPRFQ